MRKRDFKYQVVYRALVPNSMAEWMILGPGGPYLFGDDREGAISAAARMVEEDKFLASEV